MNTEWTPMIPILWDEDTSPSPNRYLTGASAVSMQKPIDTHAATEMYAEGAPRTVSDDIPVQTHCACGRKPRCTGPCEYPDSRLGLGYAHPAES